MKWGTSSLNFGRRPWPLSARLYPAYGVSVDAQFASDRSEGESPEFGMRRFSHRALWQW